MNAEPRPARRGNTPARRREILDAALAVLSEHGWRDTTMLRVAQRANASKETLYAWFGDKAGLFAALVQANAEGLAAALAAQDGMAGGAPQDRLTQLAEALLALLLSERALAVNRAAIAEASTEPGLARLLAAHGRDTFAPRIAGVLKALRADGHLAFETEAEAVESFLGLVLGDLQIRRLLGVVREPGRAERQRRAARAAARFLAAYAP